jgi:DNA-binding transcriptional MerR regulator
LSEPIFESRDAAAVVGVPERRLRYWSDVRLIEPSKGAEGRPGIRRGYDVTNLVEASVLRELEKFNIVGETARKAVEELRANDFGRDKVCSLIISSLDEGFRYEVAAIEWGEVVDYYLGQKAELDRKHNIFNPPSKQEDEKLLKEALLWQRAKWAEPLYRKQVAFLVVPIDPLWKEVKERVEGYTKA